jgi:hypothetical protein
MKHDREVLSTPALSESARQISANQGSREMTIENFLDVVAWLVARAHARENRLKQNEDPPAEKGPKGRRRRKSAPAESEVASGPVAREKTNRGASKRRKRHNASEFSSFS